MYPDPDRIQKIIRETAETKILPRFERLAAHDIQEKAPGDLVTIADQEAERVLSQRLSEILPGSVAIGEEGVAADPETLNQISKDHPVWIIDPVDGTHNFAHGTKCFAVIVCLVKSGHIEAGWIHDPVANSTIYAGHGEGAWDSSGDQTANESNRLHIVEPKPIARMTGSLKRSLRDKIETRQQAGEQGLPKITKRLRCVGREYMELARGNLDFVAYSGTLKPWDHAAGILIYREAGGIDRMVDTASPYQVEAELVRGEVMLAPTEDVWDELDRLIND